MNDAKLGISIRNARKEKVLSQSDLADKLGVTQVQVSKWETDKEQPDIEKEQEIQAVLGIVFRNGQEVVVPGFTVVNDKICGEEGVEPPCLQYQQVEPEGDLSLLAEIKGLRRDIKMQSLIMVYSHQQAYLDDATRKVVVKIIEEYSRELLPIVEEKEKEVEKIRVRKGELVGGNGE